MAPPVRSWKSQGFHCARAASFAGCPRHYERVNLLSATGAGTNFYGKNGKQRSGGDATTTACSQLGEQPTGGVAIHWTGGAANQRSQ